MEQTTIPTSHDVSFENNCCIVLAFSSSDDETHKKKCWHRWVMTGLPGYKYHAPRRNSNTALSLSNQTWRFLFSFHSSFLGVSSSQWLPSSPRQHPWLSLSLECPLTILDDTDGVSTQPPTARERRLEELEELEELEVRNLTKFRMVLIRFLVEIWNLNAILPWCVTPFPHNKISMHGLLELIGCSYSLFLFWYIFNWSQTQSSSTIALSTSMV